MNIELRTGDIFFWLGMIRFIIVGVVIIVLAINMNYFMDMFEKVDTDISAILLWATLMLFGLTFFKLPRRGDLNDK